MAITLLVVLSKPIQTQAQEPVHQVLNEHLMGYYFLEGQKMAKQILADPTARWHHFGIDPVPQSYSGEIGNGIWYASGGVETRASAGYSVIWEAIFVTDRLQPLYVKVGDLQSGDRQSAFQQALVPSSAPVPATKLKSP